eukprot:4365649-Lingulodinium_polyedra.AAC.1
MVADGETDEGTVLLCQTAGSPRALWPITGQEWTPPPATVTADATNARWAIVHCQDCQYFRRLLTATRHIPDGEQICVSHMDGSTLLPPATTDVMITFDGGAHEVDGLS